MASVTKFTEHSVRNHLRHLDRQIANSSNPDIDSSRTEHNYCLSPDRGMDEYAYYKQRKEELYCWKREDVKVMAGWVCTAPQDLPLLQQEAFFEETYRFLSGRYGEENVVKAVVHMDEAQPHLHFYFLPVVDDDNPKHPQAEKICANDLLNPQELSRFHPAWQEYLEQADIHCTVHSGITKANGGNRTVWQLKQERDYQHEYERELHF